MTKNAQRQSQVVSSFGPGAMVDLPTRSVVIGGLELWDMRAGTFETVSEPRLARQLERLLRDRGRLPADKSLGLRTPPVGDGIPGREPPGVISPTFPSWFVRERVENGPTPSDRRRRLVPWQDLDTKGRRKFAFDDGVKSEVTPIRFVCACENGHLQDLSWRWVVHGATPCREPMWVQEKGTSADPADTSIACGCGARLSLQDLFTPGRLGKCVGERPWLLDRDPDGCDQNLKLLIRTATNTYFPQTLTVISLPAEEDELTSLVDPLSRRSRQRQDRRHRRRSQTIQSEGFGRPGRIRRRRQFNGCVASERASSLEMPCPQARRSLTYLPATGTRLASTLPDAKLRAHTDATGLGPIRLNICQRNTLSRRGPSPARSLLPVLASRVLKQRRRRPTATSKTFDWLSAALRSRRTRIGCRLWSFSARACFFTSTKPSYALGWRTRMVREREEQLQRGYMRWVARYPGRLPDFPGLPYVLLHSLSHALMQEIALDCGYPASSLKARVYALKAPSGSYDRCGILIYIASTGAQGTLGGLVGTAPRFAEILESAFGRVEICSNDPVCADHEPDGRSGDRATHGAACHGCLLIAETSCESRNQFLDRALLVRTMRASDAAFLASEPNGVQV